MSSRVFGRDLGIDQLLFHEAPGAVGTSSPGRMAPNTAVAFLIVVAAWASAEERWRWHGWMSAGLALGAALLTFVAGVAYVSGVTEHRALGEDFDAVARGFGVALAGTERPLPVGRRRERCRVP